MGLVEERFKMEQDNLQQLVTDLEGEVTSFKNNVLAASELADLQQLKYQDMLDKAGEIELAVDNMPEDTDVEEEVEEDER